MTRTSTALALVLGLLFFVAACGKHAWQAQNMGETTRIVSLKVPACS